MPDFWPLTAAELLLNYAEDNVFSTSSGIVHTIEYKIRHISTLTAYIYENNCIYENMTNDSK